MLKKITQPDYYDRFYCVAGDCESTCCELWQVVVDEQSARSYEKAGGDIGRRLRQHMMHVEGEHFFDTVNGRCPFLNSKNLCDIYTALGENALCRTCAAFPRFTIDFGGRVERGISISCPEAARLILSGEGLCGFEDREQELPVELNCIDAGMYFSVLKARQVLYDIIENGSDDIETICGLCLACAEKWQREIDKTGIISDFSVPSRPVFHDIAWAELLCSLEQLTEGWHTLVRSAAARLPDYSGDPAAYRRMLHYYIYRYFAAGVFDEDVLTPTRLAVFAVRSIARIAGADGNIRHTAVRFSREVEHSPENLDAVLNAL